MASLARCLLACAFMALLIVATSAGESLAALAYLPLPLLLALLGAVAGGLSVDPRRSA